MWQRCSVTGHFHQSGRLVKPSLEHRNGFLKGGASVKDGAKRDSSQWEQSKASSILNFKLGLAGKLGLTKRPLW